MKVLVALLAPLLVSSAAAQFEVSIEPSVVGRGEEHLSEAPAFMRYLDGAPELFWAPRRRRLLDEY